MVHEQELKGASQGDIVEEDEYASLSGMLALHSIAARATRLSWLTIGWPQRLNRCLSGDELAEDTINELKGDHLLWHEFFYGARSTWMPEGVLRYRRALKLEPHFGEAVHRSVPRVGVEADQRHRRQDQVPRPLVVPVGSSRGDDRGYEE